MIKSKNNSEDVCKYDSQLLPYWKFGQLPQVVTHKPIPIKLVIKKTSSGTTLNGIKIKHIPSAEELVDSVQNDKKEILEVHKLRKKL